MRKFKKIFSFILALSLALSLLASCKSDEMGGDSDYSYDPYDNIYKESVPTGKKISVKGKEFYFEDIMIYDKDENKQVTAENSLRKVYGYVSVIFTDEDTVEFDDSSNAVFSVPETKGIREGNVLTIEHTNKDGYTYDIRIEIHEDKVIVIHEGHTYNNPGTYATITFVE